MTTLHHEPAVLELWELMQRCLGKPELVKRVLNRFETQLTADVARISAALESQEFEQAREAVHRLKGAAANVAAHALYEQAHSLESALQMELSDQYALAFRGLAAEQERFLTAVKQVNF